MDKESVLSGIRGLTPQDVVTKLKQALASEYYAYHMYRSAYYKLKGSRRAVVIDELMDHANEELEHATEIEERIMILGGDTFADPTEWDVWNQVDIPSITSSDFSEIVKTIGDSEHQAVKLYLKLFIELDDDPVTQDMILKILTKEQEHVFDVKYNIKGSL